VLRPLYDPDVTAGSPRRYWWVINDERVGDRRGEWKRRPEPLAHLSIEALERKAKSALARIRRRQTK
jgi:hypothetical protein